MSIKAISATGTGVDYQLAWKIQQQYNDARAAALYNRVPMQPHGPLSDAVPSVNWMPGGRGWRRRQAQRRRSK